MARTTPDEVRELVRKLSRDDAPHPLGELLRQHGKELPDNIRRNIALVAGGGVAAGSTLGEWIKAGELRPGTLKALRATIFLQGVRGTSAEWRDLHERLQAAADVVEDHWPGTRLKLYEERIQAGEEPGGLMQELGAHDPHHEAFRIVLLRVAAYVRAIAAAEADVEAAGFQYHLEKKRLEIPPGPKGGAPQRELSYLVEALVQSRGPSAEFTPGLRDWIARELSPYFSAAALDTSKDSMLYRAIKRALTGT